MRCKICSEPMSLQLTDCPYCGWRRSSLATRATRWAASIFLFVALVAFISSMASSMGSR